MKILAIIDMQNDFVTGALKNDDAKSVIRYIKEKIREAKGQGTTVVFTMDTHGADYMDTIEGASSRSLIASRIQRAGKSLMSSKRINTRIKSSKKKHSGLSIL